MLAREELIAYCQELIDQPIADMLTSGGEEAMRRGARQALTVLKAKLEDDQFEEPMRDGIYLGLVMNRQYASVVVELSYLHDPDIYEATMRQLQASLNEFEGGF